MKYKLNHLSTISIFIVILLTLVSCKNQINSNETSNITENQSEILNAAKEILALPNPTDYPTMQKIKLPKRINIENENIIIIWKLLTNSNDYSFNDNILSIKKDFSNKICKLQAILSYENAKLCEEIEIVIPAINKCNWTYKDDKIEKKANLETINNKQIWNIYDFKYQEYALLQKELKNAQGTEQYQYIYEKLQHCKIFYTNEYKIILNDPIKKNLTVELLTESATKNNNNQMQVNQGYITYNYFIRDEENIDIMEPYNSNIEWFNQPNPFSNNLIDNSCSLDCTNNKFLHAGKEYDISKFTDDHTKMIVIESDNMEVWNISFNKNTNILKLTKGNISINLNYEGNPLKI